jgi:zinc transport system substrate-binding protein
VDKVGGDLVTTRVLVKNGQDPHIYEPTPRQVASLAGAQIWFIMDMEFEAQLVAKIRQSAPALQIVDMTENVQKIAMTLHGHGDEHAEHDEHGDKGSEGHEQEEGHGVTDPHVWLSPPNLKVMATGVAEALKRLDPANSAIYERNLESVHAELDALHRDVERRLKPYAGSSFYVFHPSFGYYAQTYGLVQEAVETGGKSPGPRQLTRLIEMAKADGVKMIFVQPQFDPKSAMAVATAIGGSVVPLDALAEDVAGNMRVMAEKIEQAMAK